MANNIGELQKLTNDDIL